MSMYKYQSQIGKAAEELKSMYENYDGRADYEPTSAVKTNPLWDDTFEFQWPTMPKNSSKDILVSKLLGVPVKKLPGPDFSMPVFETSDWPSNMESHIPNSLDEDIQHYVVPTEAGYWFCYALRTNKPAFMSGVKGCGKSTLPKYICGQLKWPFLRKQMAKDLDSSEFFGQWISRNGNTEFIPGDLPQAALGGMVFLIDEISNAPPELHPALHWSLEKNGRIYLNSKDGDIEDKIIIPKETFRMCASDNTRGQGDVRGHYAGTDVMNSATMDRFRVMISMDYMSEKQELTVLKNTVPGCTDRLGQLLIQVAKKTRAGYACGDLSETLSMRPLIEWAEKCVLTKDVTGALTTTFLNKIDSESERNEIISYVQSVFGSLLNS